jgi:hypothetical protein
VIFILTIKRFYHLLVPERIRIWIRQNVFYLEYQEIHIERIEQTYEKLCKWIKKHPETMLMLTFSINEPSYKTLKLYEKLISTFKNPIGLHVHLIDGLYSPPTQPLQDYQTQYEIINRGYTYLKELGVFTTDFTSGNWKYNEDTFQVCKKLNLINVHIKLKEIPKITYDFGIPKGIYLIPVVRHTHDYEI